MKMRVARWLTILWALFLSTMPMADGSYHELNHPEKVVTVDFDSGKRTHTSHKPGNRKAS